MLASEYTTMMINATYGDLTIEFDHVQKASSIPNAIHISLKCQQR